MSRGTSSAASLNVLLRLADRVGLTIALAEHNDRLTSTIAKLEREREWVNAITQSVADPIVLTDLDNQILLQNKRAEELFSGSEAEDASEGKLRALKMNDLLFSAYLSSVTFSSGEVASRDLSLSIPSRVPMFILKWCPHRLSIRRVNASEWFPCSVMLPTSGRPTKR